MFKLLQDMSQGLKGKKTVSLLSALESGITVVFGSRFRGFGHLVLKVILSGAITFH